MNTEITELQTRINKLTELGKADLNNPAFLKIAFRLEMLEKMQAIKEQHKKEQDKYLGEYYDRES